VTRRDPNLARMNWSSLVQYTTGLSSGDPPNRPRQEDSGAKNCRSRGGSPKGGMGGRPRGRAGGPFHEDRHNRLRGSSHRQLGAGFSKHGHEVEARHARSRQLQDWATRPFRASKSARSPTRRSSAEVVCSPLADRRLSRCSMWRAPKPRRARTVIGPLQPIGGPPVNGVAFVLHGNKTDSR